MSISGAGKGICTPAQTLEGFRAAATPYPPVIRRSESSARQARFIEICEGDIFLSSQSGYWDSNPD